jgi:hypothetical protein
MNNKLQYGIELNRVKLFYKKIEKKLFTVKIYRLNCFFPDLFQ